MSESQKPTFEEIEFLVRCLCAKVHQASLDRFVRHEEYDAKQELLEAIRAYGCNHE